MIKRLMAAARMAFQVPEQDFLGMILRSNPVHVVIATPCCGVSISQLRKHYRHVFQLEHGDFLLFLDSPVEFDAGLIESAGIATWPLDARTLDGLIDMAMRARDRASLIAGKRGYCLCYDAAVDRAWAEQAPLLAELARDIENDSFSFVFQPIVCASTGRTIALEMLARHPKYTPAQFIPAIERGGLAALFDLHVVGKGIDAIARFAAELPDHEFKVSVNVHPDTLLSSSFQPHLFAKAIDANASLGRLDIEITETNGIVDYDAVSHAMDRIRHLGVAFSIDDFGVGYSSISHIRKLSATSVKVDRAFVTSAHETDLGHLFLTSIASLARLVSRCVVAEGIETEADSRSAAAAGCTALQGYYISRPMPINEVFAWMATQNRSNVVNLRGACNV